MFCRTNSFLDRVNKEFFQPRGLACLLMAYDPTGFSDGGDAEEVADLSKAPPSASERNFPAKAKRRLRNPVTGKTGEDGLPSNVAPLVYENAEDALRWSGEPGKQRKPLAKLNDYLDRRAQARYVSLPQSLVLGCEKS